MLNGDRDFMWENAKVLEMDGGDAYTTMRTHLMLS